MFGNFSTGNAPLKKSLLMKKCYYCCCWESFLFGYVLAVLAAAI